MALRSEARANGAWPPTFKLTSLNNVRNSNSIPSNAESSVRGTRSTSSFSKCNRVTSFARSSRVRRVLDRSGHCRADVRVIDE
ncbi:hypothetical protein M407DRAFT_243564 [Tulasnella calospora MUT 4182]|uniref:Uncharacterized protein n=1 Tax=Tulasnella calospora MUT 4182 TaxID=1051891 RepID=A0A0C3QIU3_9AGAM|nr:hypothetical protein M407DRAFT_243564 [Tulasnella calospora MUT 4182]